MAQKNIKDLTPPVGNLYLTGFMCAGKTSAGRALAKALRRPFRDADALFVRSSGRSVAEFVRAEGLAAFRRAEAAVVRGLAAGGGRVVALGGGFYPSGTRAPLLKKSGTTIFLYCPWQELEDRLKAARRGRPLLAGPWEKAALRAKKLYETRLPCYRRADLVVNIAGLNAEQAAAKIKRSLKL
ncbi:MAG TPA: shikimate kinase [Elusimicrobia bacterium]|nr:shikimate kinase [Elusimicrobiota bacterium]HAU89562.1 shikimate kinase [Elusimicrobiota bacterium]